jgi:glutamate-1-semialdehyde 2,1-aminomutase
MEMVAPLGDVYQAGTLSGNPIAMACGIATLKELKKQDPYKSFNKNALKIKEMLMKSAEANGIELQVNHFGSMINPFFTSEKVTDFKSAQKSDTESFKIFFWSMMENGVFLPPSQFEAWFLSSAIKKEDMKIIKEAIEVSMARVASNKFQITNKL